MNRHANIGCGADCKLRLPARGIRPHAVITSWGGDVAETSPPAGPARASRDVPSVPGEGAVGGDRPPYRAMLQRKAPQ